MKTKYWFLICALLFSAYMADVLTRRASVSKTHSKAPNGEESISRLGQQPSLADGIPGAVVQSVPPKGSRLRPKPGASGQFPEIAFLTAKPEMLTPAGLPIAESGTVNMKDIEDRILSEQLAESLRNPAYLAAAFKGPLTPIDPDNEEAGDEAQAEETPSSSEISGISEEGAEEKLQVESALNETDAARQLSEANPPAQRMRMPEAGVPISESGAVGVAEIEARMLNEQLAASLRNPAYLQPGLTELPSEEPPEEDGVD